MSEPNLQDLQAEVTSLKKIINVLIEQNDALKAENLRFKQQIELQKAIDSTTSQHIGANSSIDSLPLQQLGVKNAIDSLTSEQLGAKEAIDSASSQDIGTNSAIHSTTPQQTETKEAIDSTTSQELAANNSIDSEATSQSGMNRKTDLLPAHVATTNENIYALAGKLYKAGIGAGRVKTAQIAAKLLIHFYNQQPGEYKYLLRLTSYSEGGLAKLLMKLRQKGYLIKSGFQQHTVADKGIKLMMEAGCK